MVRLKVQEDNIKLKMNAPDGATFRTNEYAPIMSGSSDYNDLENKPSIEGVTLEGNKTLEELGAFSGDYDDLTNKPNLFSGDYDDLMDKPSINGNTLDGDMTAEELGIHMSDLINDDGYLKVTDLGVIDGDQYDWDIEEYLNTLQESGSYIFLWDEFRYWVDIEALEVDGTTTVEQIYWGTEEGSGSTYYRNLIIENGEVIDSHVNSYLTSDVAINLFAPQNHYHYRIYAKAVSVWDYCDESQINMQNGSPMLYTDTLNNKNYVIETWRVLGQHLYTIQKVTDLNDPSYFCQRSSYYYFGTEHWGNWYKFSGTVFDPNGR